MVATDSIETECICTGSTGTCNCPLLCCSCPCKINCECNACVMNPEGGLCNDCPCCTTKVPRKH